MRVPLTTRDFLDRAELVYGDRVGVVDEPTQPAALARRGHLPRGGPPRPRVQRRPRRARHRRGRAGRRSSATTPPGCSSCCSPSRRPAGCWCRSTSGSRRRRSPTSSGTPARGVLLVDPELETSLKGVEAEHRLRHRRGVRAAAALRRRAAAVGRAGRGRHRHDQLHQRDDGAAQGRADDPPQHLGQRGHLRHAHAGQRPRRLPAHAADVPLQRLGDAVHDRRARARSRWCSARSTAPRSSAGSSSTA